MVQHKVKGLTADRARVILQVGDLTVEVPLEEIHRAERRAGPAERQQEPLSPRVIQQRIRSGESAEAVAESGGWRVEVVQRYEGPVLAEREHHARLARLAEVDGFVVQDLVAGHLRQEPEAIAWDSWLVEDGRWEVQARAAGQLVRLSWDSSGRTVRGLDEAAHQALRVANVRDDVLTSVLRPVSSGRAPDEIGAEPVRAAKRLRAQVPDWADITQQVSGKDPEQP